MDTTQNPVNRPDMCCWEEKKEAFYQPATRLMVVGHRGDNNRIFPENSIEGCNSVLDAGVDIVETDLQRSKDQVMIIMHDASLLRTTDWAEKKGQNGLPSSPMICDWTYEQLRCLRLKGKDGFPCESHIPCLEDLIRACKNRAFITLDKDKNFDWEQDIQPLIEKHEAFETILVPYVYSPQRAYAIQCAMMQRYGAAPYFFSDSRDPAARNSSIEALRQHGMPPALRGTEFSIKNRPDLISFQRAAHGQYKYYVETLARDNDTPDIWWAIAALGFGYLMGNDIYGQLHFVSTIYPDYTDRQTWLLPGWV